MRLQVGAYVIELTHPDKVLFPGPRPLTKRDLVDYYRRVAPTMLPYLAGRPIVMQRFPDGIEREGFFHKDIPDYFPEWVDRVTLPKKDGTVVVGRVRHGRLRILAGATKSRDHSIFPLRDE